MRFAYERAAQDARRPTCTTSSTSTHRRRTARRSTRLLGLSTEYKAASLRPVRRHRPRGRRPPSSDFDHEVIDPIFGVLEYMIHLQARGRVGDGRSSTARRCASTRRTRRRAITVAFGVGLVLLACFALVIVRFRRRLDAARAASSSASQIAISDPLTGLRNHRAFQEDLARELQRVEPRPATRSSLVLLDLDGLKAVNDRLGHQAGDERLQALAEAIRAAQRAERPRATASAATSSPCIARRPTRASGRSSSPSACSGAASRRRTGAASPRRSELRRRSDDADPRGRPRADRRQAHPPATSRSTAPTGAEPSSRRSAERRAPRAARWRARSPARSTPRTPTRAATARRSRSCARVIAAELGLDGDRVARVRLGGLLHDVGKIGVPGRDPQQARPRSPTPSSSMMKRHSLLGGDIVEAADMHDEARWVRHHHERYDGSGYPDGLAGDDDPARVADHPRRRRVRGDDVRPPVPRRAGSGVRGRRSCSATRARSSTRTSSTRCAGRSTASVSRLRAVALLELLARAAPARVVAADLLVLVDAALLDHRRRGSRPRRLDAVAGRRRRRRSAGRRACRRSTAARRRRRAAGRCGRAPARRRRSAPSTSTSTL